jgi:hypothetical protein
LYSTNDKNEPIAELDLEKGLAEQGATTHGCIFIAEADAVLPTVIASKDDDAQKLRDLESHLQKLAAEQGDDDDDEDAAGGAKQQNTSSMDLTLSDSKNASATNNNNSAPIPDDNVFDGNKKDQKYFAEF